MTDVPTDVYPIDGLVIWLLLFAALTVAVIILVIRRK